MTLWVDCPHGNVEQHWLHTCPHPQGHRPSFFGESECLEENQTFCPGGRLATREDLAEALGGEKVWYCMSHFHLGDEDYCTDLATVQPSCRMVERVLSPLSVEEKHGT